MSEDELIEKIASKSTADEVRECLKEAGFTLKASSPEKSDPPPPFAKKEGEGDDEPKDDDDFGTFQKKTLSKNMKAFGADKEDEAEY